MAYLVEVYDPLWSRSMRSSTAAVRNTIVFAIAGAVAPIASMIIISMIEDVPLSEALSNAWDQVDEFMPASSFSALLWVVTGLALLRYGSAPNWAGRIALRFAVAFAVTSIAPHLLSQGNALADAGETFVFPQNVIAFLRAGALVGLVQWLRAIESGSRAVDSRWTRSPPIARGPHQVTRLLCGHALLGGASFRQNVIGFFENKWTAVAPEVDVDIRLVLRVAADESARNDVFQIGFGVIGAFYLLILSDQPALVMIPAIAATILYFAKASATRRRARIFEAKNFALETARLMYAGDIKPEIVDALRKVGQNLIVYNGFTPFVGCGVELGGWSFVTLTDRPKLQGAPSSILPFTSAELYEAITEAVADLGISKIGCEDMFFVSGTDVRYDKDVMWGDLAGRPRQVLDDMRAESLLLSHDQRIRHYKCIQAIEWGGDLVTLYFIHCEVRGKSLLVETKRYLLPPLANKYRSVDRMGPERWTTGVSTFVTALFAGPILSAVAPLVLFFKLQEGMSKGLSSLFGDAEKKRTKARRKAIEEDPVYDYGAATTLRASFAQNFFQHHFQKSDADLTIKLIERKFLDELTDFLDARGIDSSDLRERSMTILNSGILVQGGMFEPIVSP